MKPIKNRRDKGFAVIMTTLSLLATMLLAGLGFDVATLYLVRTKLQGAADAASLAAVRALAQNGNIPAAQTVGTEFLTANFPSNYWGAQALASMPVNNALSVSMIDKNGNAGTAGTTATAKLVTVSVGVSAPLYFLRILGQNFANVYATATAKRQGLLIMLVLDGSGSMQNLIAGTAACTWAKNDAQAFLGNPQFDPDIDRIGLVTFGGNTYTVAPIANFQSPAGVINHSSTVYTALNGFGCGGNTNTVEGLQATYTAMQNFYGKAGVNATREDVLILMTDGAPNGFTADWSTQIKSGSLCGPAVAGGHMIGYTARETPTEEGIFAITPWTSANMPGATGSGSPGNVSDNGKCVMDSDVTRFSQDFTQVPTTDAYGDQMTGAGTYLSTTNLTFSTTSPPLAQPTDEQQFRDLSSNAADGAATRLRTDPNLRIAIYSIALAGNSGTNIYDVLDPVLLQRMANATTSTAFNPSQPVGAYFYAQDATYLGAEFTAVASQISARLAK
jgi:Flp pilus assembly protein TadG